VVAASSAQADDATGTVVSPSGEPVSGAEVIVATPERAAWPNVAPDKRRKDQRGAATAMTDSSGRFTVSVPKDAGLLCIHHSKVGYAEARPSSLAENAQVKLEPWCRVDGVLKVGAKTAPAGTKVKLSNFGWGHTAARVHYGYVTETGADGRYVLDRVPAGVVKIETQVSKTGTPVQQYTGATPDKPTRFDIGGTGRPVIGKVILPAGLDFKRLNKWPGIDSLSHLRRDVPWPSDVQTQGRLADQDAEDALRAWRRTPAAVEAYKSEYRCEVEFQPDGTFRFDDVPPGKYVLSLSFHRLEQGSANEEIAGKKIDVVVPDAPAPTDEPLDLGEIELGNEGL
jgi:hypothetical protein